MIFDIQTNRIAYLAKVVKIIDSDTLEVMTLSKRRVRVSFKGDYKKNDTVRVLAGAVIHKVNGELRREVKQI